MLNLLWINSVKISMDAKIPTQTQEDDSNPHNILCSTKRIESGSPSEQIKSQRVRKEKDFGLDFISY